jgi:hypothetical protein
MKYYNNKKEITMKEAHELKDKSGLVVSDKEIKFKKQKEKTK